MYPVNALTEFLTARLDEDEAAASSSRSLLLLVGGLTEAVRANCATDGTDERTTYLHFDRWGPARVLAEVAAKREILTIHRPVTVHRGDQDVPACDRCDRGDFDHGWPCATLLALARVYADRPDFDPAWASPAP
jgi:hypothetical protein